MGEARTAGFLRYYEIPGYNHASSTVFNAAWDAVTALENRGEQGMAPPARIVADTADVSSRTWPLSEYPMWPKYAGSGDMDMASSFACALR